MLNMLLSFAQYERELTGQRIRDKVAASKKKGVWMGGYPPLGYDCKDRKLVINEDEASVVRFIYEQFQIMESCMAVSDALNRNGYRTKLSAHTNGRNAGNKLYAPKDVRRILTNPCYKGYVIHKENLYPGKHEAIIDEPVWAYAQTLFKKYNQDARKGYRSASPSFLKGFIKCAKCGVAMTLTYAYNHGLRYRYYACSNHIRHKTCESAFKTIPAEDVEEKVIQEIIQTIRSPEILTNINRLAEEHAAISKQNLIMALKNFTDVWAFLCPTEQQKIVSMLTDEVLVGDEGIKIGMNLKGFDRVMVELAVE